MKKAAKQVTVFKGLKGLVASGPGTKKVVDNQKLRPEGGVHIDAGNLKPASGMKKTVAGSSPFHGQKITAAGHKGIHVGTRPEGPIKRDSASVLKP